MPKNFWQSVLFTSIMATLMVLIMSTYNMILHTHGTKLFVGFNNFFAELIFSLPIALFFASKIAPKLALRLVGKTQSFFIISTTITFFIASIMVPVMTMFVLARKYGFSEITISMYLHAIIFNFIVAFPVQVFVLGRFVKFLFRNIMGIFYNIRSYCLYIRLFLRNQIIVFATKVLIIANALFVCFLSAI